MKLLLAIDHSKFSEAAIQTLIAHNQSKDAEVRVLHVIELYPLHTAVQQAGLEVAVASEEHRHHAQALVDRAARTLRDAGFSRVTASVAQGDPKTVVIDTAAEWKADLVVLGSHGGKGLARFPMGSVSEAVARHAPCSVEIVRIRP